eukprot:CAMPEP_0197236600 /NCGR_PEP_ID=MMETSP1429-20130617/3650_1 /TAXON_ID=49237 /ORGANISM="Chaetoceros  sp., Strain UNC1202" /LENGTH=133 /DNA_ID=CAMNT_0042695409 /DNA_START=103 /DNA_END=504 /DNA_ORIENTATION=+
MASSAGEMLAPEDESEVEVRREDQENINKFGRLNARLHECRDEIAVLKKKLEEMDDASTELMMGSGDKVILNLGNAFFELEEEAATEFCEDEVNVMQDICDKLEEEEGDIVDKQNDLKKALYGRFGKSINLDE